jgi:hypothetical protein
MSTIPKSIAPRLSLRIGLSAMMLCSLATAALADDQTMRTFYPGASAPSNSAGQSSSPGAGASGSPAATYVPVAVPNFEAPPADNSGVPPAVRRLTGSGHLPSAMPNPATQAFQGGQSAQDAEHQRVLDNMRRHGYSEDRIRAMDPYMHQSEAPGTTYRMVNGIKVRNDGMTFGHALNNVTNSGLMNTPINSDPRHYAQGTYGYYRGMGGTKNFGQWLNGER